MHGRVVAVVGATGAIGSAVCREFAAAGAACVVTYRRDQSAAARLIESLPGSGHWSAHADVEDRHTLDEVAASIAARHGRLDALVNCAGTTRFVPHQDLDGLDDELIDRIFRVNWRGPFAAIRACRALLAAGDGGLVINVSSMAGTTALGSNVAYCASKAAVDSMTKSLARALAPSIRVVSLAPGLVDTDFVKGIDAAWRDDQIRRTPMGRLATPAEIGAAALAIATHFPFSTGCMFPVDGGRHLV